jgi:hypothetical protein
MSASEVIRDWPLLWFADLDAALRRGDWRRAQNSRRKLERLGYEVRFTFPVEALTEKPELAPLLEGAAAEGVCP